MVWQSPIGFIEAGGYLYDLKLEHASNAFCWITVTVTTISDAPGESQSGL